jgi:hypothetical protein
MQTPVVMLVFNRPELTRRNLAAVRAVAPPMLFVVADGPRPDRPDDARLCAEVRAVIGEVDWPCEVVTRFAESNLGLDPNIEQGIDWVFSQVDRAIFLEDDCIADPTFFTYCEELLERYRDDRSVWMITGDNHEVPESLFGDLSYDFATWASVWGWASWADRWQAHRALFDRDHTTDTTDHPSGLVRPHRTTPAPPHADGVATEAGRRHFAKVALDTDPTSYFWDHHWWVTIINQNGLSAVPRHNLVENDGYGEGATNVRAKKEPRPARPLDLPIRHPAEVRRNDAVEAELELVIVRTDGRLSRIGRWLIRPLWLRAAARKVITSRLVWPLIRRVLGR